MWQPTTDSSTLCHSFWTPTDELYHHGILGMKWGKKNGPPYPLGSEDHSASEKKAGWKKSLGGGSVKSKKPVKDKIVYTFAGLQKDHDNGKELSENDYHKLVNHRLDETDKEYPGFRGWLYYNNYINEYDPKTDIHNKFLDMYKKESLGGGSTSSVKKKSKTMASKKETKTLLKRSKNPYYQKDVREFGKMSEDDFKKEISNRKKAYDAAEKALKEPSKSRGESVAKKELAETAFNRYITMLAYEMEIEKMRKD